MRTVRNSSRLLSEGMRGGGFSGSGHPPESRHPQEQTPQNRYPLGAGTPQEQAPPLGAGTPQGTPPPEQTPCCKACWDTTCNAC